MGKTTIALLLAQAVDRPFISLSALNTGVKELREVIAESGDLLTPVVFIDEIHRFNKSQQDALLGAVEKGKITLIGATTENPSFEVNSALLSVVRSIPWRVWMRMRFKPWSIGRFKLISFLKQRHIQIEEYDALVQFAAGDARKALNWLTWLPVPLSRYWKYRDQGDCGQGGTAEYCPYDKSGEQHYDIISAFIKSLRGSDPDATLYWMARMLKGGEDPVFIARRMLIAASEDIG